MIELEKCEVITIHDHVVEEVRKSMPADEILSDVADLFKVFGDSTRIRILCALMQHEMCVCDLTALLGMTQSAVSHQLKALRQARLVKSRRDGKVIYYSLDDEHIEHIFKAGYDHIVEK